MKKSKRLISFLVILAVVLTGTACRDGMTEKERLYTRLGAHSLWAEASDGVVYYVDGRNKIYWVDPDGQPRLLVEEEADEAGQISNLTLNGGWLYYMTDDICRIKKDGSERQVLFQHTDYDETDPEVPGMIAGEYVLQNGSIYFKRFKSNGEASICRIGLSGGVPLELIKVAYADVIVGEWGDWLLYFEYEGNLKRVRLSGTDEKILLHDPGISSNIVFDGEWIYFVSREADRAVLQKIRADGTDLTTFDLPKSPPLTERCQLNYYGKRIYYLNAFTSDGIWRVDADGENNKCVLEGQYGDLVAAGGKLFFYDAEANKYFSTDLDGRGKLENTRKIED